MSLADADARLAAIDPTRSVCVSAPAGSGKTELLIQRFLGLLARVEHPEAVLAITFTRKAAAEMRERILGALLEAAAEAPIASEHGRRTRELAERALFRDREAGWGLLENGNRLRVRTIDSFCAELARQMPLLSTLGGAVSTVDDASELYREAAEGLLGGLDRDPQQNPALAALLAHLDNNWERLANLLASLLACRDQWYSYLGEHRDGTASEAFLRRALHALAADVLGDLSERFRLRAAALGPLLGWRHAQGAGGDLEGMPGPSPAALPAWRELAAVLLTGEGEWRKKVTKTQGFPGGAKVEAVAAMNAWLEEARADRALAQALARVRILPSPDDAGAWPILLSLARVLPRAVAQLLLVFQRRGAVDHSQMALAALDALGEDDTPTDLALRLDYRIEHILVDEFQDTSHMQFELVRRLTRGWAEHNAANTGAPRTVLVVGDGMQSIYGFRDANVSLFLKARDEGFDGLRLVPLQLASNFRSVAPVVEWVNDHFAAAFPPQDDVVAGRVRYTPAVPTRQGSGGVAVHCFRGEDGADLAAAEADFVAAGVLAALRQAPEEPCAVLGRTRRQLQPVLSRLRTAGVSVAAQDVDALASRPVIADLLVLCRALADRYDRLAWFSLLRAPWCGLCLADLLAVHRAVGAGTVAGWLTGERAAVGLSRDGGARLAALAAVLGRAEATRDRRGLRGWLETAWLGLGGPACYDPDSDSAAAQFFTLVERAEAEARGLAVPWLEREVSRLYAAPGDPRAPVQVMTLHKAKGLQFDRVWLLDIAASTRGDERELLAWDEHVTRAGERFFLLAAEDHSDRRSPSLYQYLREEAAMKRSLEATRLLYVGATRAVRELVLCVRPRWDEQRESYREPASAALAAALWPRLLEGAAEHSVEPGPTPSGPAPLALERLAIPGGAPEAPSPESPGPQTPREFMGFQERCIGTAVHRVLEALTGREPLPACCGEVEQQMAALVLAQAGLPAGSRSGALAEVIAHVDRTLAEPQGRWVLAPHPEGATEWSLTALDEAGDPRQLVLDRYFRDGTTGEHWIIDYKTSRPLPEETAEAFEAREAAAHGGQLARYREALEAILAAPVRCGLYFTALGRLLPFP
ncbi:UvrD-helicase domain-containing protein [Pseudohaliea rubra]|uniref:DNA 3'-5' helicase n=1 Tax=Pseudohaliea rubra DSM 19751 TaxID=1265313 RepID=A0A095VQ22_9GAMM|nr:UvrD-helicase domain-containing protein [Pseudohaliea rubra]KGE03552.1 ATP-dependent DNA helicase pcrA [Pseudohaliea rubra DSM 19751]